MGFKGHFAKQQSCAVDVGSRSKGEIPRLIRYFRFTSETGSRRDYPSTSSAMASNAFAVFKIDNERELCQVLDRQITGNSFARPGVLTVLQY